MVLKPKRKCRLLILSGWYLIPPGWRFSAVNEGIGLWLLAGCILTVPGSRAWVWLAHHQGSWNKVIVTQQKTEPGLTLGDGFY